MPPVTPSRTRAIATPPAALLAVAVLDLARGDLLERDREVVLRPRVHHRRRVLLEGALTEVVVVRVDLARALGGDDHARVVGVDVLEQSIDARGNHWDPV